MNKLIKNLTVAAAISITIIGVYAPATASANGGSWQRDSVGWWYKNSNGSYPKNDWQRIDGKWYYFDGRGYITHSKWERIKDYWYYFNTSGHMTENAWEMIGDKWYYFDTKGHMLSNQWVGDYYVGKDGDMLKNTVTPDNYVVGSDGKWDKRFSRELAEIAKYQNLDNSRFSKFGAAHYISTYYKLDYTAALQLLEIIYPNYNPINNAKRAIKFFMPSADSNKSPHAWVSRSELMERFTDTGPKGYFRFSKEEVEKALDELNHEIDVARMFQMQAIKALKSMDSYSHRSKVGYEEGLTENGFTKEEIDNALNTVKIDFAYNAQLKASDMLSGQKPTISRNLVLRHLQEGYKFTKEEAEEGLQRLNYDFKINLRNLIEKNYTTSNGYNGMLSKKSIIIKIARDQEMKDSESYIREVLEEYDINYTERAKLRAMDMLKNGKYGRSNLIKILVDGWGFTKEEANNAVKDLKHENLID